MISIACDFKMTTQDFMRLNPTQRAAILESLAVLQAFFPPQDWPGNAARRAAELPDPPTPAEIGENYDRVTEAIRNHKRGTLL